MQILLPLRDNAGRPFERGPFRRVERALTENFGGLTAYTRAPAEGLWKDEDPGSRAVRDDIVVYEVMVEILDPTWWGRFREDCERTFAQDVVVVRAQVIRVL